MPVFVSLGVGCYIRAVMVSVLRLDDVATINNVPALVTPLKIDDFFFR